MFFDYFINIPINEEFAQRYVRCKELFIQNGTVNIFDIMPEDGNRFKGHMISDMSVVEDLISIAWMLKYYGGLGSCEITSLVSNLEYPEKVYAWFLDNFSWTEDTLRQHMYKVYKMYAGYDKPPRPIPFCMFIKKHGCHPAKKTVWTTMDVILCDFQAMVIACMPLHLQKCPKKVWLTRDLLRLLKGYLLRH